MFYSHRNVHNLIHFLLRWYFSISHRVIAHHLRAHNITVEAEKCTFFNAVRTQFLSLRWRIANCPLAESTVPLAEIWVSASGKQYSASGKVMILLAETWSSTSPLEAGILVKDRQCVCIIITMDMPGLEAYDIIKPVRQNITCCQGNVSHSCLRHSCNTWPWQLVIFCLIGQII